jgi:hypothetical protein
MAAPGLLDFDRAFLAMSVTLEEPPEAAKIAFRDENVWARIASVDPTTHPQRLRTAVASAISAIVSDLDRTCLDDPDPPA